MTRHIASCFVSRYDGAMTDASHDTSLSPDGRPDRDEARLELRASDADRDRTAAVLGGALAAGRLTTTEYAERLDTTYAAKTLGELAPLTRDLPAGDATDASVAVVDHAEVTARFSKVIRSGRWVAGRRTRLTAHYGALIVNLADAVLPGREITLEIDAFCGKLILTVPAGAHVIDEGGALLPSTAASSLMTPTGRSSGSSATPGSPRSPCTGGATIRAPAWPARRYPGRDRAVAISYRAIDAATPAFSDSVPSAIGMRTSRSHAAAATRDSPRPSEPTTRTSGPSATGMSRTSVEPAASRPATKKPAPW